MTARNWMRCVMGAVMVLAVAAPAPAWGAALYFDADPSTAAIDGGTVNWRDVVWKASAGGTVGVAWSDGNAPYFEAISGTPGPTTITINGTVVTGFLGVRINAPGYTITGGTLDIGNDWFYMSAPATVDSALKRLQVYYDGELSIGGGGSLTGRVVIGSSNVFSHVRQTGGDLSVPTEYMMIGGNSASNSKGEYILDAGTLYVNNGMYFGWNYANCAGTLTQNGGTVTVAGQGLQMGISGGSGTYNLNGGTLFSHIQDDVPTYGPQAFNFGGGSFKARQNFTTRPTLTSAIAGSATAYIDTNGATVTWRGAITGAAAAGLTKQGAGTLILGGANTYVGATTVNAGTLQLGGSLGGTDVTINAGATLLAPNTTIGTANAGSLNMAGQSAFSALNNAIGTLTLPNTSTTSNVLTLGGEAGNQAVLNFEIGPSLTADKIAVGGKVAVNPGGAIINIAGLTGFTWGTYNLITFPSGQASGLESLTLGTVPTGYNCKLQTTDTAEQLVIIAPPIWQGGTSTEWGTASNWASNSVPDAAGTLVAFGTVGSNAACDLVATNRTAGAMTFNSSVGTTVQATGTPTPGVLVLDNSGSAATILAAGTHTIAAGVQLNSNIAVTVNTASDTLTMSGPIAETNFGTALTKNGAGTLVLSGASKYSGGTTVSAGTLRLAGSNNDPLNPAGSVTLQNGSKLDVQANQEIADLMSGPATNTVSVASGKTLTVVGSVSFAGAGLWVQGAGEAIFSGFTSSGQDFRANGGGTATFNAGDLTTTAFTLAGSSTPGRINWNSPGTLNPGGRLYVGFNGGSGTFTQTAGTVGSGTSDVEFDNLSTYNLNGGTFKVASINSGGIYGNTSGCNINFGGGTLQFMASPSTLNLAFAIGDGKAALIDTAGAAAPTINNGITGPLAAGLTKTGTGTLTLAGVNTYVGPTTVNAGTLRVTGMLGATDVTVNGGATLATGGVTIGNTSAGSLTLAGGATPATQATLNLINNGTNTLTLANTTTASDVLAVGGSDAGNPTAINFEIGQALTSDQIAVGGKMTINPGGAVLNITGLAGFTDGTYTLMTFPAGQATGLENLMLGTYPTGHSFLLQTTDTAELLIVSPPVQWMGNTADWGTDTNWSPITVPDGRGALVIFGAAGAGANPDLGATNRTVGGITFSSDVGTTVQATGSPSPGVLVLDNGASAVTIVAAGTHTISAGMRLASKATVTVSGSADSLTLSGTITEASAGKGLAKYGAGTLLLSGDNSYSGGTTLNTGLLKLGSSTALGTGPVTISRAAGIYAAQLDLNGQTLANKLTLEYQVVGPSAAGALVNSNTATSAVLNGDIRIGGNQYTGGNGNVVINGLVTGGVAGTGNDYAFFQQGTGTWTFNNPANTFDGWYYIVGGGVTEVTKLANLNEPSSLGQATTVGPSGNNRVVFGLGGPYIGGTLRYVGSDASTSDREFVLRGTIAVIDASGTTPAATLTLTGQAASFDATARTLTLTGTNTGDNTYQGVIGGATSLSKTGAGKWVLSGANSFIGNLSVDAGTLVVAAEPAVLPSSASVAAGATLAARVGETSNLTSTHVALLAGSAIFAPGSYLGVEVLGSDSFDQDQAIDGPQGLGKLGTGTLALSVDNTYAGGTTVEAGTLNITKAGALPTGSALTIGSGGTVVLSSGLTVAGASHTGSAQPVPEPGAWALLAAAALCGVAGWLRTKQRSL